MVNLTNVSAEWLPKNLEEISVNSSLVPQGWFHVMSVKKLCPHLRSVDLSQSTKTNYQDLKDLSNYEELEVLKLNGCYRVTEEGLKSAAENLVNLHTLEIAETQCTDLALHHICRKLVK